MGELYRAEVVGAQSAEVRVRLTIVSAEVQRFWTTKSFALWLLLEPIFLGAAEAGAISAVVPKDLIEAWDPIALRALGSRVVTSCALSDFKNPLRDHLSALDAMTPAQVRAYFEDGPRLPSATVRIRLKKPDLGDHLRQGLVWRSTACDMG